MVIATVLPEVKDLSLKAQVICTKFIYVKFDLSSIFFFLALVFYADENCQKEGIFKMQI